MFDIQNNTIYKTSNIENIIGDVSQYKIYKTSGKNKVEYYNISTAFDIETYSFYDYKHEKTAVMYGWTFGFNGLVILGRTWEEFIQLLYRIKIKLKLSIEKRLIVYVHNLAYEFQFMRKWLKWNKVFSLSDRKPCKALCDIGIEFRCSYILSGVSLENLSEYLLKYKVKKAVGFLDYSLPRHTATKLTEKEQIYMVNDVKVVMAYIQECIETERMITNIPLTKTGYVRRYCRKSCLYPIKNNKKDYFNKLEYKKLIKSLTLEVDEYKMLKKAFAGGFTHGNALYTNKILYDVISFDFCSSYPAVMISEKFPMSKGEKLVNISKNDFSNCLEKYNCIFNCRFYNIKSDPVFEHYISRHKCTKIKNEIVDNGRIVCADFIEITLTEIDFKIIKRLYKWDRLDVGTLYRYRKDYLPTDFVKSILKLYNDKTQLKGIEDKERDYMLSKSMLNSCYGMCVTDICKEEIVYNDDWNINEIDYEKSINIYNSNRRRFLFYPWGVWVTAYARANIFSGILNFGDDYVYSDTDSIKVLSENPTKFEYIEKYNNYITRKLEKACINHKINVEMIRPATINGEVKNLGVYETDGIYHRFKFLGAKRYLTEENDKKKLTVSGLNKKIAMEYITEKSKGKEFDFFTDEMYIPKGHTGKKIHTYIDTERQGVLRDYNNIENTYYEKSCIHLDEADYSLNLGKEYINFLYQIQD